MACSSLFCIQLFLMKHKSDFSGLDWIINEFMSDDDLPKNSRDRSGRVSVSGGFYSPEEVKSSVEESAPDPYQVPAPSLSAPSPKDSELVFGDFLTRTKNPVRTSRTFFRKIFKDFVIKYLVKVLISISTNKGAFRKYGCF